jgi:hypothetical protein
MSLTLCEHFHVVIFIFLLSTVAEKGMHIDDTLSFSWSLDDKSKLWKESFCLQRSLWKEESEFEKDKTNVKSSDHLSIWARLHLK